MINLNYKDLIIIISVSILTVFFVGNLFQSAVSDFGSATPGLVALQSTSSQRTVGTTAVELFENSRTQCSARIITTYAEPILVNFNDSSNGTNGYGISSTTIRGDIGHLIGASSTLTYSSGEYGCGQWSAISATPNASTITITETY